MDTIGYVTVTSALITVLLILLQQRGASLGAGFGASGELYTTRRGVEKRIFQTTVLMATVFVMSILISILFVK